MIPICCVLDRGPTMPPISGFDPWVEPRILEMRISPPEHLGRIPGPRALLSCLPRDPMLQAAQVPFPRSSRTIWKLLRKHGCILPKLLRNPRPSEPLEPLEEIPMDAQRGRDGFRLRKVPKGSGSMWWRWAMRVDVGTSIALFAQESRRFSCHFMRPHASLRVSARSAIGAQRQAESTTLSATDTCDGSRAKQAKKAQARRL
jgi:hypothetical protein